MAFKYAGISNKWAPDGSPAPDGGRLFVFHLLLPQENRDFSAMEFILLL